MGFHAQETAESKGEGGYYPLRARQCRDGADNAQYVVNNEAKVEEWCPT